MHDPAQVAVAHPDGQDGLGPVGLRDLRLEAEVHQGGVDLDELVVQLLQPTLGFHLAPAVQLGQQLLDLVDVVADSLDAGVLGGVGGELLAQLALLVLPLEDRLEGADLVARLVDAEAGYGLTLLAAAGPVGDLVVDLLGRARRGGDGGGLLVVVLLGALLACHVSDSFCASFRALYRMRGADRLITVRVKN